MDRLRRSDIRELELTQAREQGPGSRMKSISWEVVNMHGIVRSYSGPGAKELFNLLETRKEEVEGILRGVTGFVSYSLIHTEEGGISVTVCQDRDGTEESSQVARDWVQANAADLNISPPVVSEGSVVLHIS